MSICLGWEIVGLVVPTGGVGGCLGGFKLSLWNIPYCVS